MDARVTVKENGDFRRIYRRGRSAVSGGVVVYCLKNRKGMSRLGVTVSTKLGHAVVRNRVRRRLRELYRLHKAELLPGLRSYCGGPCTRGGHAVCQAGKAVSALPFPTGVLREDA